MRHRHPGRPRDPLDDCLLLGELSLDGSVRHVNGVLPIAHAATAWGYTRLFVPAVDAPEAALVQGITVYPVESLTELVQHLNGEAALAPQEGLDLFHPETELPHEVTFEDGAGSSGRWR